jgi:hypothetical protein
MTIAAVGFDPLGLPRGEFSGSAAVVETQRILLRLAAADPQANLLTLYDASCTCRKMGFWENSPTPRLFILLAIIMFRNTEWQHKWL